MPKIVFAVTINAPWLEFLERERVEYRLMSYFQVRGCTDLEAFVKPTSPERLAAARKTCAGDKGG
jgi:hypothetical protein